MREFIDLPVIMIKVKAMLEFGFITEENMKSRPPVSPERPVLTGSNQSSGWGQGGCAATVDDVRLLKANIQAPCRVNVSGRVITLAKMKKNVNRRRNPQRLILGTRFGGGGEKYWRRSRITLSGQNAAPGQLWHGQRGAQLGFRALAAGAAQRRPI